MGILAKYRRAWPRIGGALAVGVGGAVALTSRRTSRPRAIAALNFAALLVHQFEEYVHPGYFPGHFNGGVFRSARPDRYPLNANQALLTNTLIGYSFYLLPIARADWFRGGAYMVAFTVASIPLPMALMKDEDSPYPFTEHQLGRYRADRGCCSADAQHQSGLG
jgi:hypothetical protein